MAEYTPTTKIVRQLYANSMDPAGFDRWLAGVKAEALREAADALDRDDMAADRWYADWLDEYANNIKRKVDRDR